MTNTLTEYKGNKGSKVRKPKRKPISPLAVAVPGVYAGKAWGYPHAHLPLLKDADVPDTILMNTLFRAVRTQRANGTMAESRFVAWLCNRMPVTMIDIMGNVHVDMRKGPMHRTMFTSHTDTVHNNGGPNNVRLDTSDPLSVKWRADKGSCLGADDGAGIALMAHMMAHNVPGYYIFFRGEEVGGIGSRWLSEHMKQLLKEIDRCVSFDRAGYTDVITHQGMGRCCSDTFALALADALTPEDMSIGYVPDDGGVFTDSANLVDNIGECTNLSVGYKHQHGDGEWQDVTFLQKLADVIVTVEWDKLPVERKPGEVEPMTYAKWQTQYSGTTVPGNAGDFKLDVYSEDVVIALEDASWGAPRKLLDLLAEYISPRDSATARKQLDIKRVSVVMYESYAQEIRKGGIDAYTVMDILEQDLMIL